MNKLRQVIKTEKNTNLIQTEKVQEKKEETTKQIIKETEVRKYYNIVLNN